MRAKECLGWEARGRGEARSGEMRHGSRKGMPVGARGDTAGEVGLMIKRFNREECGQV
jgi:hypothetical protein